MRDRDTIMGDGIELGYSPGALTEDLRRDHKTSFITILNFAAEAVSLEVSRRLPMHGCSENCIIV